MKFVNAVKSMMLAYLTVTQLLLLRLTICSLHLALASSGKKARCGHTTSIIRRLPQLLNLVLVSMKGSR